MGDQESQKMTCKASVSLPYDTPVVGCEINPIVRVQELKAQASIEVSPYSLSFTWLVLHSFFLLLFVLFFAPSNSQYVGISKCSIVVWLLTKYRKIKENLGACT